MSAHEPSGDQDRTETVAGLALREVLEPSAVPVAPLTGNRLVDALMTAARAIGIAVPENRAAQVARDAGDSIPDAAVRLGVPVREVRLAGRWWTGESGPYVVFGGDGEPAAAVPVGNRYVLARGVQRALIDRATAADLSSTAWGVTGRVDDRARLRDLFRIPFRSGSRQDALLTALVMTGLALFGLLTPIAAGAVVGDLVPLEARGRTVAVGLLLVLAAVGAAGLTLLESLLAQRLQTRIGAGAVAILLDRLMRLPLGFFRTHQVGDLVQRSQALDMAGMIASSSAIRILSGLLLALSGTLVMVVVSPGLAVLVLLVLLGCAAVAVLVLRRQLRAQQVYVARTLELSATSLSLFAGIAKIRVAGAEDRMQARWTLRYARQQHAARDVARMGQLILMLSVLAPVLITVTVVAGSNVVGDQTQLARFTTFVTAAGQTAGALAGLLTPASVLLAAFPLVRSVQPVLAATPEPPGSASATQLVGGIELANITHTYPEAGAPALSDVSISIDPGEFVALVGPSGSGKSTLLRVMIGLEKPSAGEVLFDGRPLERLGADSVRRQIGVVTQSAHLATGTILENILGAARFDEDRAWRAAELAGIAEDIHAMPLGMRTIVSDGASTFSGGQKQRILLARALAREPRILLLDEATSALDNPTQQAVSESMRRVGATRVVVAQRLSTIRSADRIIVLSQGRVVEQGTYADLMAAGGLFAALATGST